MTNRTNRLEKRWRNLLEHDIIVVSQKDCFYCKGCIHCGLHAVPRLLCVP